MAKSKFKNLIRLGLLIALKESYFVIRNFYGLLVHPFLTTKKIMQEKDLSQGILIFGMPFYLWLGWVMVLLVSRVFIFQELRFGILAKSSFLLITAFVSLFFLFLGYWILKVKEKGI